MQPPTPNNTTNPTPAPGSPGTLSLPSATNTAPGTTLVTPNPDAVGATFPGEPTTAASPLFADAVPKIPGAPDSAGPAPQAIRAAMDAAMPGFNSGAGPAAYQAYQAYQPAPAHPPPYDAFRGMSRSHVHAMAMSNEPWTQVQRDAIMRELLMSFREIQGTVNSLQESLRPVTNLSSSNDDLHDMVLASQYETEERLDQLQGQMSAMTARLMGPPPSPPPEADDSDSDDS